MRHSRQLGTDELPHLPESPKGKKLAVLTMAALGIVYGDIGTSPLYSVREAFMPEHGVMPTPENVMGVLSLILWSLIIIISVKYLGFILRADNQGEGGILALASLVTPTEKNDRTHTILLMLGLFGTSLVYGEGLITPAISVLSAVEGLEVATPTFQPYIVPITIAILIVLFLFQRSGTAGIGKVFGPVTLLWFATLAVLGVTNIANTPDVLWAISPAYGWTFLIHNGWRAFLVLGSVVLVVTGAEALYADMGHFGRRPIRLAWFTVVLPALLLNYFGQCALIIANPAAAASPFYLMAPKWALLPVVAIATAATVIASQALISGAFSLTKQAVQLGYAPRTRIAHTSESEIGQIYIPGINWGLMIACIALVLGFRTSSNLAAAYGLSVTTTMVVSTILFYFASRELWQWPLWRSALVAGGFMIIDLAFWGANLIKIPHGGWFPLAVGAVIFTLLTTWKRGRRILAERMDSDAHPLDEFLTELRAAPPHRVPGTAVFMYSQPKYTPPALLLNLTHNGVMHNRVILLSVKTKKVPFVPGEERCLITPLGQGIYQVVLRYGFMDTIDVPGDLQHLPHPDLAVEVEKLTYFLGRETVLASDRPGMALWREHLFGMMSRNAPPASSYFRLPPGRVVELGAQVEI